MNYRVILIDNGGSSEDGDYEFDVLAIVPAGEAADIVAALEGWIADCRKVYTLRAARYMARPPYPAPPYPLPAEWIPPFDGRSIRTSCCSQEVPVWRKVQENVRPDTVTGTKPPPPPTNPSRNST